MATVDNIKLARYLRIVHFKFMILKNFERQALHAYHLGFNHPTSKKRMDFDIEIPEDFKNLIELLLKY